ncbi:MAG: NAD+ synthase [Candidatus Omnitrophica bacterium]|nr:NAD+ synthase [Candidatus Omnitrophota bacterium]
MDMIRIALAQINSTVGDISGNVRKIEEYTAKAKTAGADFVIFPELAVTGYPPEDLLLKTHFIDDNIRAVKSLASKINGICAVIGFVDKDDSGNIYNAAAVAGAGKVAGVYRKRELPNYAVFDERRYFTPGPSNPVFKAGEILFGVNICEDMWVDKGPYAEQARRGAKLIFNISASPYYAEKISKRISIISEKAKQIKSFVFYTNLVGGQDELVFDGGSFAVSPEGKTIASANQFVEDLVLADIPKEKISKKPGTKANKHTPPVNTSISFSKEPKQDFFVLKTVKLSRLEEIYKALVLGTADYVRKNGFQKVVLGLSGGVDSALVAKIAVDALGRENVIGISMPSKYSSKGTRADAMLLAKNLKIKFSEIGIQSIVDAYIRTFNAVFGKMNHGIVEENVQARVRGNLLMAFSNKYGWLVLNTGNKSEVSVGYCTLYGDMSGGFAVIKDVPKTLVYELADYVNEKEKFKVIPESIIKRAPSAELRPDQKDSDSIPEYGILDPILKAYIEEDKSFGAIGASGVGRETVKKVIALVDRNEYKRRQGPPGIKITPKAFGKDRRFPITNKYSG